MINVLISSNETAWESSSVYFPRERCLTEYIIPEFQNKYAKLDGKAINELKNIPCIFAYEKICHKDARIGKILSIVPGQKYVEIKFELTEISIDYETFLSLTQVLDMGIWEMNRTHWTIKGCNLSDIEPYYSKSKAFSKVFISYCWTPISNQETVFNLVSKLRSDGVTVIFDHDSLHPGQSINYFMEQALESNDIDNIIVISNKEYASKANKRQGGVGYEAEIIISEIKSKPLQRRVIPVVVEFDSNNQPYLPTKFKDLLYIDLTREDGYEKLISAIRSYKSSINSSNTIQ